MAKVQQGEPLDMTQLSAIEINRLREQRDQLREALCRIAAHTTDGVKAKEIARAALKATEEDV